MGSPTVFKGKKTKLLTSEGLELGTGQAIDHDGERNYVGFSRASANLVPTSAGYALYNDGGATPTDGTGAGGGIAGITLTRDTTAGNILLEDAVFKFSKDAANRQGQGFSYDFDIPAAFRQTQSKVCMRIKTSANYAAGDLVCYLYDRTSAALITPTVTSVPADANGLTTFYCEWHLPAYTSTQARVIFHIATTNASAWDFLFDEVLVGPGKLVQGPVVENWKAATTEVVLKYGATTATNITSYTTKVRRVGDSIDFTTNIIFSGAANADGSMLLTIPNGLSIDTTKIPGQYKRNWVARFFSQGSNKVYFGIARYVSATELSFQRADDSGGANAEWAGDTTAGDNVPAAEAIGNLSYLTVDVFGLPITSMSAGAYYGNEQVEYYSYDGAAVSRSANGSLVPNQAFATSVTQYSLTIPQRAGYAVRLLVNTSGYGWVQAGDYWPLMQGNNGTGDNVYGVGGQWSAANTYQVTFGNQGVRVSASNAANGTSSWATQYAAGTRWVVAYGTPAALAGFNVATTSQPVGLLQAGAIPGEATGGAAATGYVGEILTSGNDWAETAYTGVAGDAGKVTVDTIANVTPGSWQLEVSASIILTAVAGTPAPLAELWVYDGTNVLGRALIQESLGSAESRTAHASFSVPYQNTSTTKTLTLYLKCNFDNTTAKAKALGAGAIASSDLKAAGNFTVRRVR